MTDQSRSLTSEIHMPDSITIDYFTDVLCVWAWISQPRLQELNEQWEGRVTVRHRYMDIFGDAHHKIRERWGNDEGFANFSAHVHKSAEAYPEAAVHRDIWQHTRPTSSQPAHQYIKAVALTSGEAVAREYALEIRRAFFVEARDVSHVEELSQLARGINIATDELQQALDDGAALAALSHDLQDARQQHLRGSPTWVLNEGRQVLFGNVGYRILHANIEELLRTDAGGASWC
jgi:predicted DsbA family dithiol-disulfide isomerase